jgi:membrane protein DedA with SNARE-associated domain
MGGIEHWAEGVITAYGAVALFVCMTLESLGAPVPGESAVIFASAAAAAGKLDIRAVVVAAFAGAMLGDNIGYLIGRKLGRPVILRFGRHIGFGEKQLARAEDIARRRGPLMVVVARFVVLLRQLNGIVAGTTGMHWATFGIANAIGAALWVGVWTTLAYRFGHSAKDLLPFLWHHIHLVAVIVVPLAILLLLAVRLRMRRADSTQG